VNNMISRLDERLDIIAPVSKQLEFEITQIPGKDTRITDRWISSSQTSQMPWLDWLRTKNSIVNLFRDKANGFATFAATLIQERQNDLRDRKTAAVEGPRLFIDRFLDAQRAHPATVDDRQVVIYTTSNVMAGSDSVAITLRTIMYMILRHEKVLKKLLQEVDGAELSFPVTWEQCQRLTYLDAVIQESLRIHPPVGFGLERVVPADGLVMDDGTRIPKGTQVSMNAWVVHLDPVFGPEPKTFKPERWLKADRESEEGYQSRLAAMKRASVAFGAGSRACMGRHLSFVEMAKLIPSLLMKFRFELALGKDEEWKTVNSWFVRQSGMDVYIENR
jgi:cytochrome P450